MTQAVQHYRKARVEVLSFTHHYRGYVQGDEIELTDKEYDSLLRAGFVSAIEETPAPEAAPLPAESGKEEPLPLDLPDAAEPETDAAPAQKKKK